MYCQNSDVLRASYKNPNMKYVQNLLKLWSNVLKAIAGGEYIQLCNYK